MIEIEYNLCGFNILSYISRVKMFKILCCNLYNNDSIVAINWLYHYIPCIFFSRKNIGVILLMYWFNVPSNCVLEFYPIHVFFTNYSFLQVTCRIQFWGLYYYLLKKFLIAFILEFNCIFSFLFQPCIAPFYL